MTINAKQLAQQVVIPTLRLLDQKAGVPYSSTALHLVMGTLAQESLLGTYLVQEDGPALGIGQVEPSTLNDLVGRLSPAEQAALAQLAAPTSPEHNVVTNLAYAVAVTRLLYWKVREPLPQPPTVTALFGYYKAHYNTAAGAATLAQFIQNWNLTGIDLPRS
jgi:hypothetical protein